MKTTLFIALGLLLFTGCQSAARYEFHGSADGNNLWRCDRVTGEMVVGQLWLNGPPTWIPVARTTQTNYFDLGTNFFPSSLTPPKP